MYGLSSVVTLCIFVQVLTVTTSTSAGTNMKSIDLAPKLSNVPASLTISSQTDTKSSAKTSPQSSSPENSTSSKPSSDLGLIASIPTFDFSIKQKETTPEVVNTCNTKDMCIKGFCMKGKCKTKKCSTDVICVCDPGFTGQICDKNITEVELKNGKNGKAADKTDKKTTSNTKELVNGRIDRKLLSENGKNDNGNFYDNENGHGKTETVKIGNDANGQNGNNGDNGNGHDGNGHKENGNDNGKRRTENSNGKMESANNEQSVKQLPDGSYVKGPEVYVAADNSAIDLKANQEKIGIGKPAVVKEKTDTVTTSTVAIEKAVGIAEEILASVKRDNLNINKETTRKNPQLVDNTEKKRKTKTTDMQRAHDAYGKGVKDSTRKSNKTLKEKSIAVTPEHKFDVVSSVDIVNDNHVVVSEETGVVNTPNKTIAVTPLLANSEIKITIETSKIDSLPDKRNATHDSKRKNTDKESAISADNGITSDINAKNDLKQTGKDVKNKKGHKESRNRKFNNTLIETTSQKTTTTTDHLPVKGVGASKNTESRKSMKSEILNPIIQLMNIIGSEKFVEKVSAVKIEIITKQNGTETKDTVPKEINKPEVKAVNSGIKTETKQKSQISNSEVLSSANLETKSSGTTQPP